MNSPGEREITLDLDNGSTVILRFEWQAGSWICRTDTEFLEALRELCADQVTANTVLH